MDHDWDALAEAAANAAGSGPTVISEYHGTCPCCGQRWEPGEAITFDEDEDAWVCPVCAAQR